MDLTSMKERGFGKESMYSDTNGGEKMFVTQRQDLHKGHDISSSIPSSHSLRSETGENMTCFNKQSGWILFPQQSS